MGVGGRDDLIAVTLHADNHTPHREPECMHLLPVKACALLHDELHDQRAMPLHTAAVTAEVSFQQRFINGLVAEDIRDRLRRKTGDEER
jgi:hypothetical protein